MSSDVVQGTSRRKADAPFQSGFLDQLAVFVFQLATQIRQLDARFAQGLSVIPNLSVDFGSPPNLAVQIFLDAFPGPALVRILSIGLAFQQVVLDFSPRVFPSLEEIGNRNRRFGSRLSVLDGEIRKGRVVQTQVGRLCDGFLDLKRRNAARLFLFLLFLFAFFLFRNIIGIVVVVVVVIVVVLLLFPVWFGSSRDFFLFGFFLCRHTWILMLFS
mmetsp:Transcript_1499/g.3068  ORF Transcript_1499/g.3068 Transcript_1499/m.3068 type:complete len:215 (-) Transcript_1499:130-774(-)